MFTDQITRLCAEIVELRGKRGALMADLARGNQELKQSVANLCAESSGRRMEMARTSRADRAHFMKNLRQGIRVQSQELQTDLAGARKAWSSLGT